MHLPDATCAREAFMLDLLGPLVLFAAVMTLTPGPNVVLVTASAANFGFRRTLPQMLGITFGFGLMVMAAGLGVAEFDWRRAAPACAGQVCRRDLPRLSCLAYRPGRRRQRRIGARKADRMPRGGAVHVDEPQGLDIRLRCDRSLHHGGRRGVVGDLADRCRSVGILFAVVRSLGRVRCGHRTTSGQAGRTHRVQLVDGGTAGAFARASAVVRAMRRR